MKTTVTAILTLALCCVSNNAVADMFGSDPNQFAIEFVTIGDPGNAADMTGDPNPAGSVPYLYRMGKYEVSRDMVTKANAEGGLDITLSSLAQVTLGPRPDMPATGVSWNEAARFVNWLNTSQDFQPAYKFSAQPGELGYNPNRNIELWLPADAGYDADNPFRNSLARYVLPSSDEWYKAAFYDPSANDGAGRYWEYPTGSDEAPTPVGSGNDPGTAVYVQLDVQGPADITQAGGLSPYGVMGQGGNATDLIETESDLINDDVLSRRIVRGGRWVSDPDIVGASLSKSLRFFDSPSANRAPFGGLRVASVFAALTGDMNGDGLANFADLAPFVLGLTDIPAYEAMYPNIDRVAAGDVDMDGSFNFDDLTPFAELLSGGSASGSAVPEPSTAIMAAFAVVGFVAFARRRGAGTRVISVLV